MIAQRKRIVKLDLASLNITLEKDQDLDPMEELPLIGINNVIAMDFDYETDCVFWADIDTDRIMKHCLSNSHLPEVLVMSQLSSV